mmetsp:Transcript_168052/g.539636  ORF Transcript_168052/g.539636 Transcript_168052/m.539636 type:complete len:534 (-) Transcript_168052:82-1683(-)
MAVSVCALLILALGWLVTGAAIYDIIVTPARAIQAPVLLTKHALLTLGCLIMLSTCPKVGEADSIWSLAKIQTWTVCQRAAWFLTLACLAPLASVYALAGQHTFDLRLDEGAVALLRSLAIFPADILALALWNGGAEVVATIGNQAIAVAPTGTWLPPVYLAGSIAAMLSAFAFPLPGVEVSARMSLGPAVRRVWDVMFWLWVLSYFRIMTVGPGFTGDLHDWIDVHGIEARWPFCMSCSRKRPSQRCHHCSKCGNCVLKMDHHCPWLRRCIGFRNYKFFLVFLVYTVTLLYFTVAALIPFMWEHLHDDWPFFTRLAMVFTSTLIVFLTLLLSAFTGLHLYLTLKNLTTLEFMALRGKRGQQFDYGQGPFKNVQAALGANPLLWLLPVGGPEGSGGSFPCGAAAQPEAIVKSADPAPSITEALADPQQREVRMESGEQPPKPLDLAGTGIFTDPEDMEDGPCPCVGKNSAAGKLSKAASNELGKKLRSTLSQGIGESDDEDAMGPTQESRSLRAQDGSKGGAERDSTAALLAP